MSISIYGGSKALEGIHKSNLVPKPNYVLTSSPEKFQIAWRVEGTTLEEAEALLHIVPREFGGDPAATDATRLLRLPGFANKKYDTDFYVETRRHAPRPTASTTSNSVSTARILHGITIPHGQNENRHPRH